MTKSQIICLQAFLHPPSAQPYAKHTHTLFFEKPTKRKKGKAEIGRTEERREERGCLPAPLGSAATAESYTWGAVLPPRPAQLRPPLLFARSPPSQIGTEAREEESDGRACATPPSSEKNPTRERGGSHPRRRRSFHCRQKLPPSSQLLRWSSHVVNGCRRSGCGCRSHTGASGHFCHFRPRCRRRKTPLPPSRSNAVIVIGICRHCRLGWLPGCRRAGSKTAAVSVQPFLLRFELLRLLRKWLGTEVLAAGISIADLGLRRKGFCDAFRLWICVLR
ncbi:uncharacterized protein LOC110265102 [Arachis ipaensis]|uniref:uncharacterized protein LOC110265102 n=1 Tax=Arachis ipaensis TaxID=130454 RepID=UPI000A2B6C10|nr:uncharacterized protein LOC110265102 [Arachis ipaensis]